MTDETRDTQTAESLTGEIHDARAALVPQAHGGALRRGGKEGNKGGGRPKEAFRKRMRRILGKSLRALERDLDAHMAGLPGTLANKDGIRGAPMTRDDVQKTAELAAKYGLGKEDTKEVREQSVRYVVRFPSRDSVQQAPALPALPAQTDEQ